MDNNITIWSVLEPLAYLKDFKHLAEISRELKSPHATVRKYLNELEKKGKLFVMSIPVNKITKKTMSEIQKFVKDKKIKRLVIDSLSTLVINAPIYTTPNELAVQDVVGENIVFSPPIIGDYIVKRFVYDFIEQK